MKNTFRRGSMKKVVERISEFADVYLIEEVRVKREFNEYLVSVSYEKRRGYVYSDECPVTHRRDDSTGVS